MVSTKFLCLQSSIFDLVFSERRRVFWIETGNPTLDRMTIAKIAEGRAALLVQAKAPGEDGIVDAEKVRFLKTAARFAAIAAGQIPADEIQKTESGKPEKEPARVLLFEKSNRDKPIP